MKKHRDKVKGCIHGYWIWGGGGGSKELLKIVIKGIPDLGKKRKETEYLPPTLILLSLCLCNLSWEFSNIEISH